MNTRPILLSGKPLLAWVLLGAAIVASALTGATTYSRQNYQMTFFACNATYASASATNPTNVISQAVFKRAYINDSNSADAEVSAAQLNVSFDLLAAPATQTTVNVPGFGGSITITDAQLAAAIRKRSETAAGL